jgi:perosamine synthetase
MKIINLNKPKISLKTRLKVNSVLKSGILTQGKEVSGFEEDFSNYVEERPCVAVNSGTSGLITALLALNVGVGDEVIVPSFTFAASANAILLVGAKPIFIDIHPNTYCLDESKLKKLINSKTKAIMAVHIFGLPANMQEICRIAKENKLFVIEDAAQAHLARIGSQSVGTFGDAAVFSFYPTKNMTSAEGGMVVFANKDLARIGRLLRNQGMEEKYKNEIAGFNFRMSEIHAAIGKSQLKQVESWTEKRIQNANSLARMIEAVAPPETPNTFKHVFHQYTIRIVKYRSKVIEHLSSKKIQTGVFYPVPVHELKPFRYDIKLSETDIACKEVLSLPVHPHLSKRDLIRIADSVNFILARS